MQIPETEIIVTKDGAELFRKTVRPGDYVIGCDEGCEVQVEVERMAGCHAQLTVNFDHVLIEDLGSASGTFVNGEPVKEPTRLWPNQKIQVGSASVELHRLKTAPSVDVSLAPSTEAVRRILPDEFLREKKYDIGGVVAQGGMGAILNAREATTERTVAMKVMLHAPSPEDMVRFISEAKVTAQLEHPNVVPVHELSVDENDNVFYTMKFVRGITLRKILELLATGNEATIRKYPLAALLTVFQKVCDAIAFAHSKRVLHRDLKPENIMIGDFGEVLVMDWGLAKVLGEPEVAPSPAPLRTLVRTVKDPVAASATLAGTIMGTPQYMAPEQARGEVERLDARADIYSLGAILFHILHLRPSVSGDDAYAIVEKVGRGEIEWRNARSTVPESLAAVVRQAMALERDQRYGTVEELQADLTAYQNGFATGAENAGTWKQIQLLVRRNKAASLGVLAVLLVGSILGTKVMLEGRRAEREATRAKAALADLKKTAPTMLALAESEAGFQRFDSALEKIDAALTLDPQGLPAYWQRAWVLVGQQKFGEAVAAVHQAAQLDPAHAQLASIAPLLESIQAAPEKERWTPDRSIALSRFLDEVGARGELAALSTQLRLTARDKEKLVRDRLVQWLGKEAAGHAFVDPQGLIVVDLSMQPIDRLDPLRGLPIDKLWLTHIHVKSFEPLRGMHLRELQASGVDVSDLSPLAGMPLLDLTLNKVPATDLRPLAGMRLTRISINDVNADATPLAGMPLEVLMATNVRNLDLNLFVNAPIRDLVIMNGPRDLSVLLKYRALERLVTSTDAAHLKVLRGHPTLKFITWGLDPSKPVAQFWADFDAAQKTGTPK